MKKRRINIVALLLVLLSLCQTSRVFAQNQLGMDATSGTEEALFSGNGGLTLGWDFQVTAPAGIMVNGLGFWDYQSDGFFLNQTFDVGLWNSTGTLLAESVITSTSTLVPSLDTSGGWRMNSVSPLVLAPGLYTVGALFPTNGANQIIDSGTFQSGSGISFVGFLRQIGSPTLAMPNMAPATPDSMWLSPHLLILWYLSRVSIRSPLQD
jgi:hypothetical protein